MRAPTAEIRLTRTALAKKQLLAAIAVQPEGAKLSIPALRDALVSQADVLDMLKGMVDAGRLDRATLRPPERRAPLGDRRFREDKPTIARGAPRAGKPKGSAELGSALLIEIDAFHRRTGMAVTSVCKSARVDVSLAARLRGGAAITEDTARKVRAFIAQHESSMGSRAPTVAAELAAEEAVEREEQVAAAQSLSQAAPAPQGCAELADAIDALIAKHDLSKMRVSKHLFAGTTGGITRLRKLTRAPRRKTMARIMAFLADPPIAELRRKREHETPQPDSARQRKLTNRGPTRKPDLPLTDGAERRRIGQHRHQAAVRRGMECQAAAKLDAGETGRNTVERALMRDIERRRADEQRQESPVEQAKLALQRKGRVVYLASVNGGRSDRYFVSGVRDEVTGRQRELTPAEVINLAEQVTGQSFRRSAAQ